MHQCFTEKRIYRCSRDALPPARSMVMCLGAVEGGRIMKLVRRIALALQRLLMLLLHRCSPPDFTMIYSETFEVLDSLPLVPRLCIPSMSRGQFADTVVVEGSKGPTCAYLIGCFEPTSTASFSTRRFNFDVGCGSEQRRCYQVDFGHLE